MNFQCQIDGEVIKIEQITDKHLKLRFELGEKELLSKVPFLSSLTMKRTNVIAYIENDNMRFRIHQLRNF